ncbi:nitrilase family protein [soil metagenome]
MARAAALQLAPVVGELEANSERATDAIDRALSSGNDTDGGADIVVLPELVTSGYVFESMAEARSLALAPDDALFGTWAALAARRGSIVVAGFAELGEDDRLYNSAAVIGSDGVLAVYRKAHLWNEEKNFFTAGDQRPPVVETEHGRLGVMICYDLEFPEWTRLAALAGTDILAVPTNWPLVERPAGERAPEVQIGIAAARVNRMAIVAADRAGTERGVAWTEGTTIIDADGWVADVAGPGIGEAWAEIDPARSRDKTLTPLADAHGDRRPELYGPLAR